MKKMKKLVLPVVYEINLLKKLKAEAPTFLK